MSKKTFHEIKSQIEEWIKLDYIYPEDKILTKTMINNYSKNALLPPSDKKKYSKDHIILLIYIYYLKNFLSINDIQNLLQPMTDSYFQKSSGTTMADIYSDLFALEQQYGIKVRESIQEVYQIADTQFESSDEYLKTYAMITMLSYDIYAKKQLVEKLIDSLHEEPVSKAELKEAKERAKQKGKAEKQREKNEKENKQL